VKLSEIIVHAGGAFVPYEQAHVGLLTHGLQYGTGCFEGIRGYWDPAERELYLVLLHDHYRRLQTSAKILGLPLPYDLATLADLTVELCARNGFETDVYIRPFVCSGAEDVGVRLHDVPAFFAIVAVPHTAYVKREGGLHACVSSWRRADDTTAPPRAKITGLYVNSALAKSDAVANGFDEAILLSHDGHVSEGSAANVFLVRDGVAYTPDPSQNILEGCTRRCAITLLREMLEIPVVERAIDRSELYAADEIFFTGTAMGIVPVVSVDRRPVGGGEPGAITSRLRELYARCVLGREPRYADWVTRVYRRTASVSS
jgi:branched-chain amino acid aminotransferase